MTTTAEKIPLSSIDAWTALGLFMLGPAGGVTGRFERDLGRVLHCDDIDWTFEGLRLLLESTLNISIDDLNSVPRQWIQSSVRALNIPTPDGWGS